MTLRGEPFCCSWSGGKDSCLALYRAREIGGRPALLLTMLTEQGDRTRSHGLPLAVIQAQAAAMGLELRVAAASWVRYEESLIFLLQGAAKDGITHAVFGDIDTETHREWEERVSRTAGLAAHLPLWKQDRHTLLQEVWGLGFEALIVAIREGTMSRDLLGRRLDPAVAKELERLGVDPCGEYGEFHTLVIDGPMFNRALPVSMGEQVRRAGYWFQDVQLESRC